MRVLWFSGKAFGGDAHGSSGTWREPLARRLASTGAIELANIAPGSGDGVVCREDGPIVQWLVPHTVRLGRDGLPDESAVRTIVEIVKAYSPELVHIWGTEYFWGLITARKLIPQKALLEMQGLRSALAPLLSRSLDPLERLACIGVKELFGRSSWPHQQRTFYAWRPFEHEIIAGHDHIAVQTDWMEAQVRAANAQSTLFRVEPILRDAFYESKPWIPPREERIFCSAAYSSPFKGLHVALRALALLKRRFPKIRLRIAGTHRASGIRRDGYIHWLMRMSGELGVAENVEWLGPLSAEQVVDEMSVSSAMVLPTFLENCSATMQEAMLIGLPVVASLTGGLPSVAGDEESALFFPVGDVTGCARQLERVLADKHLATRISGNARALALRRNDPDAIVARQLQIYRQVAYGGGTDPVPVLTRRDVCSPSFAAPSRLSEKHP